MKDPADGEREDGDRCSSTRKENTDVSVVMVMTTVVVVTLSYS